MRQLQKINDIYLHTQHLYIYVMDILREIEHIHKIMVGFYKKQHLGMKKCFQKLKIGEQRFTET